MADITDYQDLYYGQAEQVGAANPRLASGISATALVILLTKPLLDEDLAKLTASNFHIGIRKLSTGYTETVYVQSGELSSDGLTITLASVNQRGINLGGLNGIDLSVGQSANRVSHEQDSQVRLNVSGLHQTMNSESFLGNIGSTFKLNARNTYLGTNAVFGGRVFADATARDAAITSPANGDGPIYLTAEGVTQHYIGGVWTSTGTDTTANAVR